MKQYAFLGAGNMASAIIKGIVAGRSQKECACIKAYDIQPNAISSLQQQFGITPAPTLTNALSSSDVILLAVKPNVLSTLLPKVAKLLSQTHSSPLIISIAAGKDLAFYHQFLGNQYPIIRVMPNINAKVGAATCAFCCNPQVRQTEKDIVVSLFQTIGSITELPESEFPIFGALAGSSPAFTYLFIDVLARAAQKAGMSKKKALAFSAQTVLGSAKMVLESAEHPWELIDQVCSPGGTTIEGIYTLEAAKFEASLIQAFDAMVDKDQKIRADK